MPESKTFPQVKKLQGGILIPYGAKEIQRENYYGVTDTFYQYGQIKLNQKQMPHLDQIKQIIYQQIDNERVKNITYMPWTVPSTGTQVHVKIAEEPPHKPRQTWLSGTSSWGLACVQEGTPDETDTLIAADDSLHSMTASEWVQFGKALKVWVRDNLMAAKQHMANIQALTDEQSIISYDYSTGWPGCDTTTS